MPQPSLRGLVGRFLGLSRVSHSVLHIPYLAVAALVAIEGLPTLRTIGLGLVAAFADLTAIFGPNDMLDRNVDARKM
jgi:4-hydroxybenzoate polyprenyltransferase